MSDDETALIAAEAAEDFKRRVEQAGTVRVQAGDLMVAFGITVLSRRRGRSRTRCGNPACVAEPSLASARVGASTRMKLRPVNPAQVNAAIAWRQTPAAKRAARLEARYVVSPVAAGMTAVGGVLVGTRVVPAAGSAERRVCACAEQHIDPTRLRWVLIGAAAIVLAALRAYTTGKRSETMSVLVLGVIRPLCRCLRRTGDEPAHALSDRPGW